jgi:hypothetical protein
MADKLLSEAWGVLFYRSLCECTSTLKCVDRKMFVDGTVLGIGDITHRKLMTSVYSIPLLVRVIVTVKLNHKQQPVWT